MKHKKKGTLSFTITLILGVVALLFILYATQKVIQLLPSADDSDAYQTFMTTLTQLKDDQAQQYVYFLNDEHILVGFSKGQQTALRRKEYVPAFLESSINRPTNPILCGTQDSCICLCDKASADLCTNSKTECITFPTIETINGIISTSDGSIDVESQNELFIEGRNKLLLKIVKNKNILSITRT